MVSYTKQYINVIALAITLVIFIFYLFFQTYIQAKENNKAINSNVMAVNKYDKNYNKEIYLNMISLSKIKGQNRESMDITNTEKQNYLQSLKISGINPILKKNPKKNKINIDNKVVQRGKIDMYRTNPWRIKIPKIGVDAPITEGTGAEALRRTVGHFEGTSKWKGNVALAAHNRGYRCNFFQEIKRLKKGDKIIYSTSKGKREYKVILNKVIRETDWTYVSSTKDNRITLITCEENKKEYRRCIQAAEI